MNICVYLILCVLVSRISWTAVEVVKLFRSFSVCRCIIAALIKLTSKSRSATKRCVFLFLLDQWAEKRGHPYLMVTKTHVVKKVSTGSEKKWGPHRAAECLSCTTSTFLCPLYASCLVPHRVTPACDGQDSWDLLSSHRHSLENSSCDSCKRPKEAAGGSWLLYFRWFRKETPRMLLASLATLQRVLPLSPLLIHAPGGAGKSTCLVLPGFAGCTAEVE